MAELGLNIQKEYILGIDFGTTNTVVSFMKDNKPFIIPIDNNNIFPTAIYFEDEVDGNLSKVFGFEAKESAILNPDASIFSVKTLLSNNKKIDVKVNDKKYTFTPKEVVGEILNYIRNQCNDFLKNDLSIDGVFSGCVITVPANSTDKYKKLMFEASVLGGFEEEKIHIRLEPTSAAINYASNVTTSKKVLVYDFGGGTFDACVLDISIQENSPNIVVLSTIGHNNLGGDIIDEVVQDLIFEKFKKQSNNEIDLFHNDNEHFKRAVVRLKKLATNTKEKLCVTNNVKITLSSFITYPKKYDLNFSLSREEVFSHKRINKLTSNSETFNEYCNKSIKDIINKTLELTEMCISKAGVKKTEIDDFILVGGSSQIPYISEKITEIFNKTPYKSVVSPALSISFGASLYSDIIYNNSTEIKVLEKTIHSFGIEISGRRFLPIIKEGVEISEKGLHIECDTPLTTNYDALSSLAIVVYENTISNNSSNLQYISEKGIKRLGSTTLTGIPKKPKGEEKIQVVFKMNQDNILTVEAFSLSNKGARTILTVDKLY